MYVAITFHSRIEVSLVVGPRFLLVSLNIASILNEATMYDGREQHKRIANS